MTEESSNHSFLCYTLYETAKFIAVIQALDQYFEDGMGVSLEAHLHRLKYLRDVIHNSTGKSMEYLIFIGREFSNNFEEEEKFLLEKVDRFLKYVSMRSKYLLDDSIDGEEKKVLEEIYYGDKIV